MSAEGGPSPEHLSDSKRNLHDKLARDMFGGVDADLELQWPVKATEAPEVAMDQPVAPMEQPAGDSGWPERREVTRWSKVLAVGINAAVATVILTGCGGARPAESASVKLTVAEQKINAAEQADKAAREAMIKEGATAEEVARVLTSSEYLEAREDMLKDPKDLLEWLEEKRQEPVYYDNLLTERSVRAENPESVSYQEHREGHPSDSKWSKISEYFGFGWKNRIEKLLVAPTEQVNMQGVRDRLKFWDVTTVSVMEYLVAIDEKNPGFLHKFQSGEDDGAMYEIPDIQKYNQEVSSEIDPEVVEAIKKRTTKVRVEQGATMWGLRHDAGLETVSMDNFEEAMKQLNPDDDFGDTGSVLREGGIYIVPTR